ncbi:nucleotidyltransferase domain-containing protein [Paenibacillus gallinarum]|uniref:Nucleotidyltransferase family protein n=1 Tax=Paenibacillus gallinarum TaxID=2762232 RepID=A0ABR8T5J2_9BACL|nr:nucleotidyltransferase family protein [Paenibacillus gallinarum]MBD7970813.1 nucleotidyltransferase family protein [Paenibacillus gallinarum]
MKNKIDLSEFSNELLFILKIINGNLIKEESIKLICSRIDWDKFLEIIDFHRIYPVMYMELSKLDLDLIPPFVMGKLKTKYRNNVMKMLQLCSEMEKVNKEFTDRGIRSIHLKGPVLAKKLYGDISLRTSKDLDILVQLEDVRKAEETLISLGYVTDERLLNVWKWKSHHISYYHPLNRTEIELHWRINPESSSASFNEVWERRSEIVFSSNPLYLLGNEDLLVYLVTHGARHGWMRLRWLIDIDRMIQREWLDLNVLIKKFQNDGIDHLGGQAIILVSQLLSTPIPEELKVTLYSNRSIQLAQKSLYILNNTFEISPNGDILESKEFKRYIFSLLTTKQKIQYFINRLYPSTHDASLLPLPRSLHFLYFPLRPFLWVWRQMKRQYF